MKKRYAYLALFSLGLIGAIWLYNSLKSRQVLQEHLASGKPTLRKLFEGKEELSFRGIAALNDSVVWVSGNFGTFGKSLDGGEHWVFGKIPGADSLQFRDIQLFDRKAALLMGSGYPTTIYKTTNGGLDWHQVYYNPDSSFFLDGMDFWPDGNGLALGDPINGKFVLLRTEDYGDTWELDTVNAPDAIPGEAAFAASGTAIRCHAVNQVTFVSGGAQARVFTSNDRGNSWSISVLPIQAGNNTKGAFSFDRFANHIVVVGGDYDHNADTIATGAWSNDLTNFNLVQGLPYQSSVAFHNDSIVLSVGTSGCFVSFNSGMTWTLFSGDELHAVTKSQSGEKLFVSGPHGRIGFIDFKK